jgi:hypothetical protein
MSSGTNLNVLEKQTPGDDDSINAPRTIEEYMSINSLV